MTGKTHQAIGLTTAIGWYLLRGVPAYNPATFAAVLIGGSLSSLLPDIDQPAGEIWDKIPLVGHTAGKVTSKITFGHRNITHSILGFFLINLGIFKVLSLFPDYWGINSNKVFIACSLSYGFHLLADSFTVEGIPLLFPYQRMFGIPPKPLEGIRIQSGKWFENLIIFPLINIIFITLVISNWEKIRTILFK